MKILIGCEESGRVRDAFAALGHDAWSCDFIPSATPGNHIIGDVRAVLNKGWNMGIFFVPCTRFALSGVRWLHERNLWEELADARRLFYDCWTAPIDRIAMENPTPHRHAALPDCTQAIQPWQFGHGETKRTCLWLKNLPPLVPTEIVPGRASRIHRLPPGPDRARERSRTYPGIAQAMAQQWGCL